MKKLPPQSALSRRRFLAITGMAAVAPTIIPSSALGRADRPAPSERITVGVVGWGMQAPGNTRALLNQKDVQVVASCNIDQNHLKASLETINGHYKNTD